MTSVTLSAPRVVTPEQVLAPGHVVLDGDRIVAVGPGRPDPAANHVHLDEGVLLPGLVDLQINGYGGVDFLTADGSGWSEVSAALPRTGVTRYLPTLITSPLTTLACALDIARDAIAGWRPGRGAGILGVHLEGPFLSPRRSGAHNAAYLLDPHPANVDNLLALGADVVRIVTLAPELPGSLSAIHRLVDAGIIVSVGHSNATAGQTRAAIDSGATMTTHVYNAQSGLHHREPGVVGAVLSDPRVTVGLILDFEHVAAEAARLVFAAAAGRTALVTDAVAAAGQPPGTYLLGADPVRFDGQSAPRRPDGTLAGSALRLDQAVANAVRLGISLVEAVAAASTTPANAIGRPELGRLCPGAVADVVWADDDLTTRAVWLDGQHLAMETVA